MPKTRLARCCEHWQNLLYTFLFYVIDRTLYIDSSRIGLTQVACVFNNGLKGDPLGRRSRAFRAIPLGLKNARSPVADAHEKDQWGCARPENWTPCAKRFAFQGRWMVEFNGDISAPGDGGLKIWLTSRQLQVGSRAKAGKGSSTKAGLYLEGG
jgi:hypothetical protein